jgi:predicted DNA-binding transcriptional regulator YafY
METAAGRRTHRTTGLRSGSGRNAGNDGDVTDPTARALSLLSLLQTHKFWSGAELTDRLGVSARTLRRDVDRLRALGYPVDASPGAAGGYRLAAGAHLPPLLLDDDEAVAIAVGLRAAASASIDGMEDTALRALAKLEQVLPDRLRRRVHAVHANVVSLQWGGAPSVDPDALAVLALACRDREQVRFDYRRRDGAEASRLVEPHQLVSAGRRWYVVAWDVRRDDWRTFRLDRLERPQLGGVRFAPRALPGGDAAAFVAESIRTMPLPYSALLDVAGPPDAVREQLRWSDAEVEVLAVDRARVRIGSGSNDALLRIVTMLADSFGVVVREPDELARRVEVVVARLRGAQ